MTATTTPTEVPRDRYGRPLLVPPGGGDPQPYTRASTMAKALDDLSNLMAWRQRMTAVGLLRRPDLMTRVAGALANGTPDDWPVKRELNKVCAEATEAAGASSAASTGTGIHALVEAIANGREPEYVPTDVAPRLDAYREAIDRAGVTVIGTEQFVVNDEVKAAGTFDQLIRLPGGRVVVGDLKTGKSEASYPLAVCIQIAVYAHGLRYHLDTHERTPIHPDLDPTTGVLIHMPPSGGCSLYRLDLSVGWEAAQLAAKVREVRSLKAEQIAQEVRSA